jgi:hypothetical protein
MPASISRAQGIAFTVDPNDETTRFFHPSTPSSPTKSHSPLFGRKFLSEAEYKEQTYKSTIQGLESTIQHLLQQQEQQNASKRKTHGSSCCYCFSRLYY